MTSLEYEAAIELPAGPELDDAVGVALGLIKNPAGWWDRECKAACAGDEYRTPSWGTGALQILNDHEEFWELKKNPDPNWNNGNRYSCTLDLSEAIPSFGSWWIEESGPTVAVAICRALLRRCQRIADVGYSR